MYESSVKITHNVHVCQDKSLIFKKSLMYIAQNGFISKDKPRNHVLESTFSQVINQNMGQQGDQIL